VSRVLSAHVSSQKLHRRAVTFLELMTSITIVLAAVSVMLPALSSVRRQTGVIHCINNLQNIATTSILYAKDNDPTGRGGYQLQPWYLQISGISPAWVSEFVYGGFRHTMEHPDYPSSDTYLIPTELRPYNKYIAPGLGGRFPIKDYSCPADMSVATPSFSDPSMPPGIEDRYATWEVNGNSYAINWHWPRALEMWSGAPSPDQVIGNLDCMSLFGSAMLSKKIGGAGSEFVLFMEGMMNVYLNAAKPPNGSMGESPLQLQGLGWHGKLSMYTMAFSDGHAEYRFIDTRYTSGPGYDIYPELDTPWPPECPD